MGRDMNSTYSFSSETNFDVINQEKKVYFVGKKLLTEEITIGKTPLCLNQVHSKLHKAVPSLRHVAALKEASFI